MQFWNLIYLRDFLHILNFPSFIGKTTFQTFRTISFIFYMFCDHNNLAWMNFNRFSTSFGFQIATFVCFWLFFALFIPSLFVGFFHWPNPHEIGFYGSISRSQTCLFFMVQFDWILDFMDFGFVIWSWFGLEVILAQPEIGDRYEKGTNERFIVSIHCFDHLFICFLVKCWVSV